MKQWEKEWTWDNEAPVYEDKNWLKDQYRFPIKWYLFDQDGQVYYIKQITKNYGVILDENYYGHVRPKTIVAKLAKRSMQKFVDKEVVDYHTMKNWMTLGSYEPEQQDEVVYHVREHGGGYIMKFHPVTRKWIQKIHVNEDGEVVYRARNVVKQRENHLGTWHEEIEYENNLGVHYRKMWNDQKKKYEWQQL